MLGSVCFQSMRKSLEASSAAHTGGIGIRSLRCSCLQGIGASRALSASLDGQRHHSRVLRGTRRAGNDDGVGAGRSAARAATSPTGYASAKARFCICPKWE